MTKSTRDLPGVHYLDLAGERATLTCAPSLILTGLSRLAALQSM